ncbi:hypothetical protein mRhiFer1_009048 [Rhinolophus ferrumequinum]|uniref:Uncharacterized protein n=1 Tax=Rhinolophus ferrumequinum TaxID=59479 RepID=A0A7J7SXR2_RHIFE|nr:hypothetical protein mRhiFer1_009048 [Rhinolophus ferrumequinum]
MMHLGENLLHPTVLSFQHFPAGAAVLPLSCFIKCGLHVMTQGGEEHPAHMAGCTLHLLWQWLSQNMQGPLHAGWRAIHVLPPLLAGPTSENSGYRVPHTVWGPHALLPRVRLHSYLTGILLAMPDV